jgi:hypothetical protein
MTSSIRTSPITKPITPAAVETPRCGNCETGLAGPFCHMCGQPVRSPVREFFSFIKDGTSDFLRPDHKFFRTLAGLYFRPGLLTTRYLDGQRINFIKPVKLYFSLSLVLFLVIGVQSSFKDSMRPKVSAKGSDFSITLGPSERPGFVVINSEDDAPDLHNRIQAARVQPAKMLRKKPNDEGPAIDFEVNGKPWNADSNPLHYAWLPGFLNRWINNKLTHINAAGAEAEKNPGKVVDSLIRVLPTTMFLLLPIFAGVLKLFYVFRRRLYAEHLLVAVQSHSFMFLSFILITLLGAASPLMSANAGRVASMLMLAMGIWVPLYLLIMQKRVYGQGWPMTLVKFGAVGLTYTLLISVGLAISIVAALANM